MSINRRMAYQHWFTQNRRKYHLEPAELTYRVTRSEPVGQRYVQKSARFIEPQYAREVANPPPMRANSTIFRPMPKAARLKPPLLQATKTRERYERESRSSVRKSRAPITSQRTKTRAKLRLQEQVETAEAILSTIHPRTKINKQRVDILRGQIEATKVAIDKL